MNAKKCKAIRQLLKSEGVDVKEAAYTTPSEKLIYEDRTPIQLKQCGRRAYKNAKRTTA